jgi:hypothetical protein
MAAATSSVEAYGTASVKTRHVPRERLRGATAGSFGNRIADESRVREEGRLDEREKSELLLLWSGNESALGCRSSHASVVDRLLRAPPRDGRLIEEALELELGKHGRGGYARDRLVDLLADEDVATRHELRRTMRGMAGKGTVEYFVGVQTREKRRRRETVEMLTGHERRDTGGKNKPETEEVEVGMVRLVQRADRRVPPAVPPAERWARADAALEAWCQTLACSESTASHGSRLPPRAPPGRVDGVQRALRRLPATERRVIEKAYGTGAGARWLDVWGDEEIARIAPMTATVERARKELVAQRSTVSSRATVDRSVFAVDAMRAKLDAQPEGEFERARWKAERTAFIEKVKIEAEKLLRTAVLAFREAREG